MASERVRFWVMAFTKAQMKRCSLVLLVMFVLARTHTPLLAALQSKADPKGNDRIDSWARDNYHGALDLLLPDRCASAIDARWLACVRIVPPFRNEIEYLLSVQRQLDGTIFAQINRPKAHSIYVQLRERRKEHAQAPLTLLIQPASPRSAPTPKPTSAPWSRRGVRIETLAWSMRIVQ